MNKPLKFSKRLFKTVFDEAGIGTMLVDATGAIIESNQALQEFLGYSEQDVATKTFEAFTFIDDIDTDRALFQDMLTGKLSRYQVEKRFVRQDGAIVWGRVTAWRLRPVTDAPVQVMRLVEDITYRKQIEQALQVREAHFRAIFERAAIGIMIVNMEGRLLESNPALQTMLGFTEAELSRLTFDDFTYPEDVTKDRNLFEELVAQQRDNYQIEKRLVPKDGVMIWVRTTVSLSQTNDQQPEFVIRMVENITARKQAEEDLRKATRAYRTLSHSNQVLVRATSEVQLLRDVCTVIVNNGGYKMAWVGIAEEDDLRTVRPVAWAGVEEGYLQAITVTWSGADHGRGPTGQAIRTGTIKIAQNIATDPTFAPWRAEALRRGYGSSIALPLLAGSQPFGALNIYAPEADAFSTAEISLLEELANDLAYGIVALQTRDLHQKAEENLKASEARYRQIVETAQEGVWIIDANATTTFVNQKTAEMLGYTVQEMVSQPLFAFMDEEVQAIAAANVERRRQGIVEQHEFTFRRKDGTPFWALVSTNPLYDNTGKYTGALAMVTDVSSLKYAQANEREQRILAEALRNTAEALTSALDFDALMNSVLVNVARVVPHDAANIMIIEGDHARPVYWQGYSTQLASLLSGFNLPLAQTHNLRAMLDTNSPYLIPDTTEHPDWIQSPITDWVRSYVAVPIHSHRQVIGFLNLDSATSGFFTEHHAQRLQAFANQTAIAIERAQLYDELRHYADQLEQRVQERTTELQLSEARYRAIVEDQTELVCRYLPGGILTFVNQAYCNYFDCQLDELIGTSFFDLLPADERANIENHLSTLNQDNPVAVIETRETIPTGQTRWIQWIDRMLFDETGTFIEYQGVGRDMTQRKRAEHQLQQTLQREMELNEMRTRFVSMASHEFRTPLTVIKTSADLLNKFGDRLSEERQAEKFAVIHSQIDEMIALLDDVLTIGRMESGRLEFQPENLNIVILCQTIVEDLQQSIGVNHQMVFSHAGKCLDILADRKLLQHVLTNLLSNAIKYSPSGSTVTLQAICDPAATTFQVRDQGIGIPEGDQAQLFEAFHRACNVGNTPGTGLGLAIVKQAVELHDGTISFESTEGVSTTFVIRLPRSTEKHLDDINTHL